MTNSSASRPRPGRARAHEGAETGDIARRAIAQVGEALAAIGPLPRDWQQLAAETAGLVAAIRKARTSDDLALIVKGLESRKAQAEAWGKQASQAVDTNPAGPEDRPHAITTNSPVYPSDTVVAAEESSRGEDSPQSQQPLAEIEAEPVKETPPPIPEPPAKVQPAELLQLAPRLADHVAQPYPEWRDIVDAAGDGLASISAFRRACGARPASRSDGKGRPLLLPLSRPSRASILRAARAGISRR